MNQAAMQPAGAFKHNLLPNMDEAGEVGKKAVHLCACRYPSLEKARVAAVSTAASGSIEGDMCVLLCRMDVMGFGSSTFFFGNWIVTTEIFICQGP